MIRDKLQQNIAKSQLLMLQVINKYNIKNVHDLESKIKQELKSKYKSDPTFLLCWSSDSTLVEEIKRYQYFGLLEQNSRQIKLTNLGKTNDR
jgi:hypothetical protein